MRYVLGIPESEGELLIALGIVALLGGVMWIDLIRRRLRAVEGGRKCRKCVYRTSLAPEACLNVLREGRTAGVLACRLAEDGRLEYRPAWRGFLSGRRYRYEVRIEQGARTEIHIASAEERALSQSALDGFFAEALKAKRG